MLIWGIGIAEATTILTFFHPLWSLSNPNISILLSQSSQEDLYLTPLSAAGLFFITFGSLLRIYCYRTLGRFFTFDISIRKGHQLITAGPYGVVRHPSYSGMFAVYVGMFCWYGSRGSWLRETGVLETVAGKAVFANLVCGLVVVLVGLLERVSVEDALLKENFKTQWAEWAQRVPYALIPWVY